MKQHLDIMRQILAQGDVKTDRTGTGTTSLFGGMMKFSLQHGMWPIPTTREVDHLKIAQELEWMIKGIVDVNWLEDRNNKIWSAWKGAESGTIGPMYGEQWRNWNAGLTKLENEDEKRLEEMFQQAGAENSLSLRDDLSAATAIEVVKAFLAEKTKPYAQGGRGGTDQLQYVVDELKNNPDSRRIVVNVWHAGLLPDLSMSPGENADAGRMALAPCHSMWQVNTAPLSDLEILREIMYAQSSFAHAISFAMETTKTEGDIEMRKYLKRSANIELVEEDLITTPLASFDYNDDRNFKVSSLGQHAIDAYKNDGHPTRKLSLACCARSQDVPLGTVFNVGMYSLMAHLLARLTNMVPWEYTHFMGDHHIYSNQHSAVEVQLSREPKRPARIIIDPTLTKIDDFEAKNTQVFYESHPKIVFPRAAV